ncbi:hypothetical protein [Corticimicrobacter populi]|uniref:Transposase n=1 Tax=Corticimicrobacter populi TaxID=2175229 RepID=A0A2V1K558_9BURK|nr:hypothetical protein [Corticimicrobacter populi]PWF24687.1 hypothetical protein DD235_00350 [Corticimicrobacter populi]
MKKRFTEEQIIGFLREADAGLPVTQHIAALKPHSSGSPLCNHLQQDRLFQPHQSDNQNFPRNVSMKLRGVP